ncbi:nuclease [Paenibacillus sp. LMG 31456]|uniref:Nuclease n=1 Tax=Paenibacillus foliorum TaxID=2654974 RepID=A0A972GRY5_9BACL|nr:thermonuclease family protein [Paenibacillus foliorum]NOU95637.1 nuclease [Paenibacillus foliorum]
MKKAIILILLASLTSGCVIATKDQPTIVPAAQTATQATPAAAPIANQPAEATPLPTAAPAPAEKKFIEAKVKRVIDGDTIEIIINNKEETVRMILVDTPETKKPNTPVQPFGPEASTFTKETLEGKDIKLERDVTERDQYKRLLYYVYIGDKMFNEMLLEKGLARVAVYPPDVKYVDQFREIQKNAQMAKIGIWSIENYATDKGYDESKAQKHIEEKSKQATPTPAPAVKEPAPATVTYKNCTEVKQAGKAPIHRGEPGYSSKLDRDNDGIACE